jgi:hypothetical protein
MSTYYTNTGTATVFVGSSPPPIAWGYDVADGFDIRVVVETNTNDIGDAEVRLAAWFGEMRQAHVALTATDARNIAAALTEAADAVRQRVDQP